VTNPADDIETKAKGMIQTSAFSTSSTAIGITVNPSRSFRPAAGEPNFRSFQAASTTFLVT
jgi:hypothetical protein